MPLPCEREREKAIPRLEILPDSFGKPLSMVLLLAMNQAAEMGFGARGYDVSLG